MEYLMLPRKWILNFLAIFIFFIPLQLKAQQTSPASNPKAQASDTVPVKKAPMILEKIVEIMEDQKTEERPSPDKGIGIDGLVIDETRTKMGRDFYEIFFNNWEAPQGARDFSLIIREKPGRATSTFVSVEINDQEVLELPLQARYDIIEDMAKYAVGRCYEYFANYEQIQKDLAGGDLSGSGIY